MIRSSKSTALFFFNVCWYSRYAAAIFFCVKSQETFRANCSAPISSFFALEIIFKIARSLSCFVSICSFLQTSFITVFWSSVSYIVKLVSYPSKSIYLCRIRTQAEWNVETQMLSEPNPTSLSTLSRISPAALLVKVMARICQGLTPSRSIR